MLDIILTIERGTHTFRHSTGETQAFEIGKHFLDAANFMIQENGQYCILLMSGAQIEGDASGIAFLSVEYAGKD